MPAPTALPEFFSLVHESGLWDEARYLEVVGQIDDLPPDPAATAARLIEHGYLTSFQARQLLAGKHRGFVLGSYRLLEPLPNKGLGPLYLGEHVGLKRRVVIKMLPAERAADHASVERFFREARAAAALDHPNLLRLHDISQGNGSHFLVMEHVEGEDLQATLARVGPLRPGAAVAYILQAAAGLCHAHDRAIVHRDVKPSNLFLCANGVLKVRGMGLARSLVEESDDLTKLLGQGEGESQSADFLAPEQALGGAVDHRADIYSLGATLYTLITGRPPFAGSLAQVLVQHQSAAAPQLKDVMGKVPDALSDIVGWMMAKAPGQRPATLHEVIEALKPWSEKTAKPAAAPKKPPQTSPGADLSQTPAPTRKVLLPTPARPRRKPRRAALLVVLLALMASAGVAVGVALSTRGAAKAAATP